MEGEGIMVSVNTLSCPTTIEAFVVCQRYQPPPSYTPTMANPLLDVKYGKSGLFSNKSPSHFVRT